LTTPLASPFSVVTEPHDCYEICGDGYDFGTFACDDGSSDLYDGCDADCVIEPGWGCAGGTSTSYDTCYEICGDEFDMAMLGCDDGNTYENDGCYECTVEDGWYCPY
jgi:large repetitive protein